MESGLDFCYTTALCQNLSFIVKGKASGNGDKKGFVANLQVGATFASLLRT